MIKIELHCHLDGSLNIDFVKEMIGTQDITMEQLKVTPDCRSLTEYLEKFELPLKCLQTRTGLKRAAYELVREVSLEGVKYIEVRFAPMLSTQQGLSCKEIIESVVEGLTEGGKRFGVFASAIVCAMRHHPLEQNIEMLKAAREFLGCGVCALDLAGDENYFPNKNFAELFREAVKWEMPFTIHSGECGSVDNIRHAAEFGAKRIGHGIALEKAPVLQQLCANRRIGIEMCPTSNLQTKAISDYSEYPLKNFLKRGLLASINTDNRTVSDTTLEKEMLLARNVLQLTEEEIVLCTKNAIETAFASDDVKHQLYQMMK